MATARSSQRATVMPDGRVSSVVAGISTATAGSTWPSRTARRYRVGAAGQRRRHVPPPVEYRCRPDPDGDRRGGGFQRRRPARPRRRRCSRTFPTFYGMVTVSVLLGNGDGTFRPPGSYAVGDVAGRYRGGGLQRRRPARPGRHQARGFRDSATRVRAAGQRRRHVRLPDRLPMRGPADADRGGRFQRRRRLDLAVATDSGNAGVACCWATATARSSTPRTVDQRGGTFLRHRYSRRDRGRGLHGDGRLDLAAIDTSERLHGNGEVAWLWARRRHLPTCRSSTGCGSGTGLDRARATSTATATSTWPTIERELPDRCLGAAGQRRRTFTDPGQLATTPTPRPWSPTSTATAPTTSWSSTAREHPLSPGHPRPARHLRAARHRQPRLPLARHRLGARTPSRPAAGQRRRPRRRRLALRLARRRLRPRRLARHRPAAGAGHRGRPQRRRLGRPGRPQRRRRHPLGLLQQRPGELCDRAPTRLPCRR